MSHYIRKASRKAKSAVREIRHSHQFLPKHSSTNSSHSSARFSDIDADNFPGSDSDCVVAETSNPLFDDDDPLLPTDSSSARRSNSERSVDSGHFSNDTNSLPSSSSDPLSISQDPSLPVHALPPSDSLLPDLSTATKPKLTDSQQKKLDELFGGEEEVDAEDDFFDELEKDSVASSSDSLLLDVPLVTHDAHETIVDTEEEEIVEESSGSDAPALGDGSLSPQSSPSLSQSLPPVSPDHSEPTVQDDDLLLVQTGSNSDSESLSHVDSVPLPPPSTGTSSGSESPIPDPLAETVETNPLTSFSDATEATPTGRTLLFDEENEEKTTEKEKVEEKSAATTERDQKDLSHSPSNHSTVLLSDATEHPLGIDDSFFSLSSSPPRTERRDKTESSDKDRPDLTFSDNFFTTPSLSPRQSKRPASFHGGGSPSVSPRGSPFLKLSKTGKMVPVVPPRPLFAGSSPSLPKKNAHPQHFSPTSAGNGIGNITVARRLVMEKTARDQPHEDLPDQGIVEDMSTSERDQVAPSHESTHPSSTEDEYLMTIFWFFTTIVYLYYSLNPFVYLAGFVCGFFLFFITIGSAFVWYVQHSEREKDRKKNQDKTAELPALESLPSTIVVDFEKHRELQSNQFGLVHRYHPTTHHPSQRLPAKIRLFNDFVLEVRYRCKTEEHLPNGGTSVVTKDEVVTVHLYRQKAFVHILPEEVAQNRKRRWSKKFPIVVSWRENDTARTLYLFTPTSRDKEEWFRRMRHAAEGSTYDQLVEQLTRFYRYMGKYMPKANKSQAKTSSQKAQPKPTQTQPQSHSTKTSHTKAHHTGKGSSSKHGGAPSAVKFSMNSEQDEGDELVKISKMTPEQQRALAARNRQAASSEALEPSRDIPRPTLPLGWITAGMARLVWDIWHEDRWRNWATSRIQRKLIRIKTPSFLEPLKVTEVHMGIDMPVIKRAHKLPKVDNRGVWVYLEVEYNGSFTMTIETKLKLTQKKEDIHYNSMSGSDEATHSSRSPSPPPVATTPIGHVLEHHHASRHTRLTHPKLPSDNDDEISSGSDDEGIGSSISSSTTLLEKIPPELEEVTLDQSAQSSASQSGGEVVGGRKTRILTSVVNRVARAARNHRIIQRAVDKASSYPLVLTVEVKKLEGFLVINMSPPPSDAIWYGFEKNPRLDLVAKPKLGHRAVTLSYVTDWIEKKLCEVVAKKLVLPNMEDLVVPILNSGLPEDKMSDLMSP